MAPSISSLYLRRAAKRMYDGEAGKYAAGDRAKYIKTILELLIADSIFMCFLFQSVRAGARLYLRGDMHLRYRDQPRARYRAYATGDAFQRRQLYFDGGGDLRYGHNGLLLRVHRSFRSAEERSVLFADVYLRVDSVSAVARGVKHRAAHDEFMAGRGDGVYSADDAKGSAAEQQVAAAAERLANLRRHLRACILHVHPHHART